MTYRALIDKLSKLRTEQLEQDVTVCTLMGEFIPVESLDFIGDSDILDPNHPVLMLQYDDMDDDD